ncbi:hypothetical protein PVK06_042961 [Gossypium arboreum]|uniref:Uncharacterized protein n=1 Tax=Gossypium arboreum TaxID=29729 RepID=A0ABR0MM76_GOSAR|nr:hypothetical protein PVK06_042961 [Gossypium arboreum]
MVNLNFLCDSKGERYSPPDNPSTKKNSARGVEHVDGEFSLLEGDVKKSVLDGFPNYLYKKEVLWEIWGMIGKVTKLDFNTDSKVRGWYAHMVVYANLDKPLISKVIINENLQRIEYESLLVACFSYGHYGYNKDSCSHSLKISALLEEVVSSAKTVQENMAAEKREFDL